MYKQTKFFTSLYNSIAYLIKIQMQKKREAFSNKGFCKSRIMDNLDIAPEPKKYFVLILCL